MSLLDRLQQFSGKLPGKPTHRASCSNGVPAILQCHWFRLELEAKRLLQCVGSTGGASGLELV